MKTSLTVALTCLLLIAGHVTGQDNSINFPECIFNDDCIETLTCMNLKCEDPCLLLCTKNASCQVHDHVLYCSCKPGFTGDPFTSCIEQTPIYLPQCTNNFECSQDLICTDQKCEDPCIDVCSGDNTVCQVRNHVLFCSCKPGYSGDSVDGCRLQYPPQCTKNDECSQDQICIDQKCEDPCIDVCSGNNTVCQVRKHVAFCSCKPGYFGDSVDACRLQYPPGSWPPYPGAKKRYKVETVKTNWYAAFTNCLNHGGRLATIMNSTENEEIKAVIRNSGINDNFWASGTDLGEDKHFIWMSTGQPFTFSDWSAGQPGNKPGVEHCMYLWNEFNYLWKDSYCPYLMYSVCEYYD